MSTSSQITANQKNAQLSTGPTSSVGKAKSSLNAVKTGLTGLTVLLPGDDAALYSDHLSQFFQRHEPKGEEELSLVQSLADTEWRLLRIPSLEFGVYAVGQLEFAELFTNEEEAVRKHLIQAKVFLVYQRQLNNLSIQEGRLRRQIEKDAAALHKLQEDRKVQARMRLTKTAREYIQVVHEGRQDTFDPPIGFEFSLEQIEVEAMKIDPDLFADYERKLREEAAGRVR